MEQLAFLNFIASVVIVGCVGYSAIKLIVWIMGLFGGVCIGC